MLPPFTLVLLTLLSATCSVCPTFNAPAERKLFQRCKSRVFTFNRAAIPDKLSPERTLYDFAPDGALLASWVFCTAAISPSARESVNCVACDFGNTM